MKTLALPRIAKGDSDDEPFRQDFTIKHGGIDLQSCPLVCRKTSFFFLKKKSFSVVIHRKENLTGRKEQDRVVET